MTDKGLQTQDEAVPDACLRLKSMNDFRLSKNSTSQSPSAASPHALTAAHLTGSRSTLMSVSKSSTPPPPKWGPVDLSKPIGTILPPGMYYATVAEVNVYDGDEALRLIVTFEILTDNGEIVSPERSWLTVAAIPTSKAATQIREGLRNLAKLARAADVDDGMTDPSDIAESLVGRKLRVKVTRSGAGINTINRVVAYERAA